MIYPWMQSEWDRWVALKSSGKIPHAVLWHGQKGVGKSDFAKSLAQFLLCESDHAICGQCRSCALISTQTHPDYFAVVPEKPGQLIKIDQIRHANNFACSTTPGNRRVSKIILIEPAESMNTASANALLKTLEEPPAGVLLLLVCNRLSSVLATVKSRCQLKAVTTPPREVAIAWLVSQGFYEKEADLWLQVAEGAPLDVLPFKEEAHVTLRSNFFKGLLHPRTNPVSFVKAMESNPPLLLVHWFLSLVNDVFRAYCGADMLRNRDFVTPIQKMCQRLSRRDLLNAFDKGLQAKRALDSSIALNKTLLLEDLVLAWQASFKGNA